MNLKTDIRIKKPVKIPLLDQNRDVQDTVIRKNLNTGPENV